MEESPVDKLLHITTSTIPDSVRMGHIGQDASREMQHYYDDLQKYIQKGNINDMRYANESLINTRTYLNRAINELIGMRNQLNAAIPHIYLWQQEQGLRTLNPQEEERIKMQIAEPQNQLNNNNSSNNNLNNASLYGNKSPQYYSFTRSNHKRYY